MRSISISQILTVVVSLTYNHGNSSGNNNNYFAMAAATSTPDDGNATAYYDAVDDTADNNVPSSQARSLATRFQRFETTYQSTSATSGFMFNIKANNRLILRELELNLATTSNDIQIHVHVKKGNYKGYESNRNVWTKWVDVTIQGQGSNKPTIIPSNQFPRLTIEAGEMRSFYISCPNQGACLRYSKEGYKKYTNSEMTYFGDGSAEQKGWNGRWLTPRTFNGGFRYETLQSNQPEPPPLLRLPTSSSTTKEYDAVIIGAGWAGMRAAHTLVRNGMTNILVLEANKYVGGRSTSVNEDNSRNTGVGDKDNVPLEMGSEWQYSSENSMHSELRRGGYFDGMNFNTDKDEDDWMTLDVGYAQCYELRSTTSSRAEKMSDAVMDRKLDQVWGGFLSYRRRENNDGDPDMSYARAVDRYIERENLSNSDGQYINMIVSIGEVDYAADEDDMSLAGISFANGQYPTYYTSVPGVGYGNIAASFAKPFMNKIKLNANVNKVNYQNSDKSVITYVEDGVTKQVTARAALVTVSLGVLKAKKINFTPRLPNSKLNAINNMGFGTLNKCIMQWNDKNDEVWPDKPWFHLITPTDETSGKWTTFWNPSKWKGVPTLVGWIGGDEAKEVEKQTDEQILNDVMKNLRLMWPDIKQPDRVIITRWGQNPYTVGTYSYTPVGRSHSTDSRNLRRKVGNVYWAGEASSSSWQACVVGGWESGEKAAREILQDLRR